MGSQNVAIDGTHYEGCKGKLEFRQGEVEKTVSVKILKQSKKEEDDDSENMFGF